MNNHRGNVCIVRRHFKSNVKHTSNNAGTHTQCKLCQQISCPGACWEVCLHVYLMGTHTVNLTPIRMFNPLPPLPLKFHLNKK